MAAEKKIYNVSFRCYFEAGNSKTTHRQALKLAEIPKWIEAYIFTHPMVEAITMKIWMEE